MAKISDTTSYPNITPVADDYLILTDFNSSLATKTVTVDALGTFLFSNISSSLIPAIDCTYDIGSATKEWRNLYVCGIARINDLRADVGEIVTLTVPTSFVLTGAASGASIITSVALVGASNTNLVSTLAIKTYVDSLIATVDDLGGSYDVSTTSVNIPTQSLRILGTANQITTTGDGAQTMQIAFPTNITTPGQLNSTGAIIPVTDSSVNLGTSLKKWQNLFVDNIADAGNNLGTALQFLRKNVGNTGLEWANVASGNSLGVRLTGNVTPTFTVDLATQDLGIVGTTNEIEVTNPAARTAALRLPLNITTRGQLNSLGPIIPTTPSTQNLGSSVNRWQNFFTKDIVDATDVVGTANQVLAKNAANTGLEWITDTNTNDKTLTISDGTTTGAIDLPTEQLTFTGTSLQLTTTVLNQQVTFAFPTNITTPGQLNSTGPIIPVTDSDQNLGSSVNRWQNFFTEGIADAANSLGTTGQLLGKNAANTGLEWRTPINSLEFLGDTNTLTPTVQLDGQSFSVLGTANQIVTSGIDQTLTLAFPTNITTPGQLNSTGPIIPTTNASQNLGSSVNRWQNFFAQGIADGANSVGAASQVLAKNAANTALEWQTQAGGGSMSSWEFSDGTTAETISNGNTAIILGTTNETDVVQLNGTATLRLPLNITTRGQLNSLGPIIPTTDKTQNLGSTANRWQNFFTEGIADATNALGTANQVLAKNAANTGLEWVVAASGSGQVNSLTTTGSGAATLASNVLNIPTPVIPSVPFTSLTTTGTSGVATLTSGVLNVPNYTAGQGWVADSDEGTDITVAEGATLMFAGLVTSGGAGIATDSAVAVGDMTIGLINAGGTPSATTFYRGDGQWITPSTGGTMSSFTLSDGTNTETIIEAATLTVAGTANQLVATVSADDTVTYSFPTNITTPGQLNSTGPIIPITDSDQNLGSSVNRWQNFFTEGIADGGNSLGAANQVLFKNSGNTALEWRTPVTGMASFNFNTTSVTNGNSLVLQGTTNEIEVVTSGLTTTIDFPTNITTKGQLNSVGPIIPTTNASQNLGSSTNRWQNFFTEGIADAANALGTANQVLAKNNANTGLEWQAQAGSSGLISKTISISNASMKTLSTTPVELIAAPGANQVLVVDSALFYLDFVSPAFNLASDLFISYSSSSLPQFRPFAAINSTIANSSADVYVNLSKVDTDNNNNGQCKVNEALNFGGPNTASGGGTVKIKIQYRIENLS